MEVDLDSHQFKQRVIRTAEGAFPAGGSVGPLELLQWMTKGECLFMEQGQLLCLSCADLDRLVFLPSGDAAMSRRAKKYSSLSAVVVRFIRARRRYERQGIPATPEAIARAEGKCLADAPERETQRERNRARRIDEDAEFCVGVGTACPHFWSFRGRFAAGTSCPRPNNNGRVGPHEKC